MRYGNITKWATMVSVVLWVCAASFLVSSGTASFSIVAILAVLAQVVGVNSAQRDGAINGKRVWLVDQILDRVHHGK